jgi:hypothetical protein
MITLLLRDSDLKLDRQENYNSSSRGRRIPRQAVLVSCAAMPAPLMTSFSHCATHYRLIVYLHRAAGFGSRWRSSEASA